jgi:5-methylcytosine-specific restriction endonuclease McrA
MKIHTKVYMTFFDYGETDFVMCEFCQQDRAVDIHHLDSRGMGGSKNKDYIENLMGLCRECHIKAESDSSFNMFCRIKHLELVCQQVYYQIEYNKKFNK